MKIAGINSNPFAQMRREFNTQSRAMYGASQAHSSLAAMALPGANFSSPVNPLMEMASNFIKIGMSFSYIDYLKTVIKSIRKISDFTDFLRS